MATKNELITTNMKIRAGYLCNTKLISPSRDLIEIAIDDDKRAIPKR